MDKQAPRHSFEARRHIGSTHAAVAQAPWRLTLCPTHRAAERMRVQWEAYVKAVEMFKGLSAKDVQWFADEARALLREVAGEGG